MLSRLFLSRNSKLFCNTLVKNKNSLQIIRFSSNESGSSNKEVKKGRFNLTNMIERALLKSKITDQEDLSHFIANGIVLTSYGFIVLSILSTVGIDTSPIVAGIGVTGFTVGFALKEIATNYFSGILLVLTRPFSKGQMLRVMVPSHAIPMEGVVESISPRYVILRKNSGSLFMIPSSLVYTNTLLVSNTKEDHEMK